jgi:excinuclease ABC subunit B
VRPTTDLERRVAPFRVESDFQPAGDQPTAIDELEKRVRNGERDVVLLGATRTGKYATTCWLIERLKRPTLLIAQI